MPEPKFIPKTGQIDFTDARYAPVVNTIVTKDGKILLVRRSKELRLYPGYWNGVSGFLDDSKTIQEKIHEELSEELNLNPANIKEIKIGRPLLQEAPKYNKTWIVVPVLAAVSTKEFNLDWEAQDARWVALDEIPGLKLLPGFSDVIKEFYPKIKL